MSWQDRITSNPEILNGKPVIKGTRVSIEHIFNLLASDWDEKLILENYPSLTKDDIKAVFLYAKDCLQDGLMFELKENQ